MDLSIERKLKRRGIKIAYADLKGEEGFLTYYRGQPVILLAKGLPENRENEIVLHELGHHKLDKQVSGSYRSNDSTHYMMECQANDYMLEHTLDDYLKHNGLAPDQVNPIEFCQSFGLADGLARSVYKLLSKKLRPNHD